MEKKFNIGDRVRFIRDYDNELVYVDKGDCGTIESVDTNFGIRIVLDSPERISIFDTDYIEQITPNDPKTAFLTRLQSLLREFDAEIRFVEGDYSPAIIFIGHKDEKTHFGKFIDGVVLYSKHCELSSDTIMDYDKE